MIDPFFIYRGAASGDIEETRAAAREAERHAQGIERRVDELERRLERTTLVTQALWELLQQTGNWSEAALLQRIEAVDQRDGRVDGRLSPTVIVCPKCKRNSSSRRRHCIYCEAPLPGTSMFDGR